MIIIIWKVQKYFYGRMVGMVGLLKGLYNVDDKLVNSLLGDVGEEGGSRRFL